MTPFLYILMFSNLMLINYQLNILYLFYDHICNDIFHNKQFHNQDLMKRMDLIFVV